jgi:hypothetical protein
MIQTFLTKWYRAVFLNHQSEKPKAFSFLKLLGKSDSKDKELMTEREQPLN